MPDTATIPLLPGKVRIVSNGTPQSTQVLGADGKPLDLGSSGILRIAIDPITADGPFVTAHLTIGYVTLDIAADADA